MWNSLSRSNRRTTRITEPAARWLTRVGVTRLAPSTRLGSPHVWGGPAAECYSLPAAAFFIASSSFLMSSGVSFGGSMVSVIFLILPVNVNGGL